MAILWNGSCTGFTYATKAQPLRNGAVVIPAAVQRKKVLSCYNKEYEYRVSSKAALALVLCSTVPMYLLSSRLVASPEDKPARRACRPSRLRPAHV